MVLNVYFGVPGSGKSTYAAHLANKSLHPSKLRDWLEQFDDPFLSSLPDKLKLSKPEIVYSNVDIRGAYYLNPKQDLGYYQVRAGRVIIDEAGLEFNSRNFKSFSDQNRTFFKMHRHEETKVDVFSQSFDDMDKSLRILARNFYIVKPSLIPYFVVAVRINRYVGVDRNTQQIVDAYRMGIPFFDSKYCFAPSVWKLFDSYEKIPNLKEKEWKTWEKYKEDGLVDGGEIKTESLIDVPLQIVESLQDENLEPLEEDFDSFEDLAPIRRPRSRLRRSL